MTWLFDKFQSITCDSAVEYSNKVSEASEARYIS